MMNFLPSFGSQTRLKCPRNEIHPSQKKEILERRSMSSRSMYCSCCWNRDVLGHLLWTTEAPPRGQSTAGLSPWEEGQLSFSRLPCNLLSMAHLTRSFYFGQGNRMPHMKFSLGSSPAFEAALEASLLAHLSAHQGPQLTREKHTTIPSPLLPSSKTRPSQNSLNTNAMAG